MCLLSTAQIPDWQWAKTLAGGRDDYGRSIDCDGKSNVVMVGDFLSDSIASNGTYFQNINPIGGIVNQYTLSDVFVSKYDSSGNVLWTESFGSDSMDIASGVTIDQADNIIVVGKFNGTAMHIGNIVLPRAVGSINYDAFVFKLDPNGNVVWAKSIGANGIDAGITVTTDENNDIYVGGMFTSANLNFGTSTYSSLGYDDIFISKYTSTGTPVWTQVFGSTENETVVDICADKNGYVYFTGEYRSSNLTIGTLLTGNLDSAPTTEVYVSKMDLNGNVIWSKTANSMAPEYVEGINVDSHKNVLITGRFSDYYFYIDGNAFQGDHILNPNCIGGSGYYLIKFDSVGTFQWFQTFENSNEETGLSVTTDKDDNIYVSAFARGTFIIIDTITVSNITNGVNLLLKYDTDGHIIWQKTFGDADHSGYGETDMDIDLSNQNILYLGGTFFKQNFVMDNVIAANTTSFTTEPLIAKLGDLGNTSVGIQHTASIHGFNFYPNPASDLLTIQAGDEHNTYNIDLINAQGQSVRTMKNHKGNRSLSLENIAAGVYFLKLSSDDWVESVRVVVTK